jgi:hypothetical protein
MARSNVLFAAVSVVLLALAVFAFRANQVDGSQFKVLKIEPGTGRYALFADVQLPEKVVLEADGGPSLKLVDENGRPVVVQYRSAPRGRVRVQVPAGYPEPPGVGKLQLVIGEKVVAEQELGELPFHQQRLAVAKQEDIAAYSRGTTVAVRVRAELGETERLTLRPLRTEHQVFRKSEFVPMTRLGSRTYQATITLPYASQTTQLEVELRRETFEADEVRLPGVAVKDGEKGPVLAVDAPVQAKTKFGRTVAVREQERRIDEEIGQVSLDIRILRGEIRTRELRPPTLISPTPESLGLSTLTVYTQFSKRTPPTPGLGGPVGGEKQPQPKLIKRGPIGEMVVKLFLGDNFQAKVRKVAIPIEQIPSDSASPIAPVMVPEGGASRPAANAPAQLR